ncbi:WXG100 family type VII secretion target [Mycolicibacterium lacusdiani]|uniref:WXG100 family type VII secretion target n=1 Tax=Mycolicibacterium lacusdiani TaxID=2895283 RepID=UPI00201C52AC|nr:WXG100 family type VII secretion target [Mycolicibacterium lacusdiani]
MPATSCPAETILPCRSWSALCQDGCRGGGGSLSELQVSESVVIGVAQELRTVVDDTRSGLTNLDGELGRLLGSDWTGEAGSAFGEVWKRWHDGAENLVKGLESMSSALEQAAQGYASADAAGRSAVDSAGM